MKETFLFLTYLMCAMPPLHEDNYYQDSLVANLSRTGIYWKDTELLNCSHGAYKRCLFALVGFLVSKIPRLAITTGKLYPHLTVHIQLDAVFQPFNAPSPNLSSCLLELVVYHHRIETVLKIKFLLLSCPPFLIIPGSSIFLQSLNNDICSTHIQPPIQNPFFHLLLQSKSSSLKTLTLEIYTIRLLSLPDLSLPSSYPFSLGSGSLLFHNSCHSTQ